MGVYAVNRVAAVLAGLATCGSVARGAIWIESMFSAALGNASWVDPVAGPQNGSYYEEVRDRTNVSLMYSLVWPVSASYAQSQTEADPSMPPPTLPGSYRYLRGTGSASSFGDAEAHVSINAHFQCSGWWQARLATTGMGSIQLHGPRGLVTWVKGDQAYAATLEPGRYSIYAGVSAIEGGGTVSFVVPAPATALVIAGSWVPLRRRRRNGTW